MVEIQTAFMAGMVVGASGLALLQYCFKDVNHEPDQFQDLDFPTRRDEINAEATPCAPAASGQTSLHVAAPPYVMTAESFRGAPQNTVEAKRAAHEFADIRRAGIPDASAISAHLDNLYTQAANEIEKTAQAAAREAFCEALEKHTPRTSREQRLHEWRQDLEKCKQSFGYWVARYHNPGRPNEFAEADYYRWIGDRTRQIAIVEAEIRSQKREEIVEYVHPATVAHHEGPELQVLQKFAVDQPAEKPC